MLECSGVHSIIHYFKTLRAATLYTVVSVEMWPKFELLQSVFVLLSIYMKTDYDLIKNKTNDDFTTISHNKFIGICL